MVCTPHTVELGMAFYLLGPGTPEALMLQGYNIRKAIMMMSQRYSSSCVVPNDSSITYG